MTNLSKLSILICILTPVFANCEKEIQLELPESGNQLVVEGWIEQGQGARIVLSKTAPFFSKIDSASLRNYVVTQAKVTVTALDSREVLTLRPNTVYFPPYYYFSSDLTGKIGGIYDLQIDFEGKTYTASTTIPEVVSPDSLWMEKISENDTLGRIWMRLIDNGNQQNYYRVLTQRVGKDKRFMPTFTSVFSDEAFNGDTIEIAMTQGNTSLIDMSTRRYFDLRDTLIYKLCSMDREHFDFWNSYQVQVVTSANPFAVNNAGLQSNIEDAIGVWGGYAASYDTIYPQKN